MNFFTDGTNSLNFLRVNFFYYEFKIKMTADFKFLYNLAEQ